MRTKTTAIAALMLALTMGFSAYAYDGIPTSPISGSSGSSMGIYMPHAANNAKSPVTFVLNGTFLQNITGYEIRFGDGYREVVNFSQPVRYYPDMALSFLHKYSAANYSGYVVTVFVNTTNETYRAIIAAPVWIAGDANGDGFVNATDSSIVMEHWGARYGEANYDDGADLNNDGVVNIIDSTVVGFNWKKRAF